MYSRRRDYRHVQYRGIPTLVTHSHRALVYVHHTQARELGTFSANYSTTIDCAVIYNTVSSHGNVKVGDEHYLIIC